MPGGPELVIVLVIVLLLFGGRKLPEIARGLGSAQREFRRGLTGGDTDHGAATDADDRRERPRAA